MSVNSNLIPRRIFFDNPDRVCVRISPDGKHLAYIAPLEGVMNIWVAPANELSKAVALTAESKRGLRSFQWAWDSKHILYAKDSDGDENWHVHSIHIETKKAVDLTPFDTVSASLAKTSPEFPHDVIISVNDRKPEYFDLYRVNIATGQKEVLYENNEFVGFLLDESFALRFGMRLLADGSTQIDVYENGSFSPFESIPYEDALGTNPLDFTKDNNHLYFLDSRGRNTVALYLVNCETKERTLLGECKKADISDVMVNPITYELEAWSSTYEKKKWRFVDEVFEKHVNHIESEIGEGCEVLSRSYDDKTWIVAKLTDTGPVRYYRYEQETKAVDFLFTSQKTLEGLTLCPMEPVLIQTRDQLEMVCYLTKPKEFEKGHPVPTVLLVHGGPQARDHWGYSSATQWLANRGYAVLSVNYRGSTGFGKSFTNAGDGEWSKKMHDDLLDAVTWCVDEGVADKDKICIYGGSYGGYATLVGLTFTPDVFACGVDIVGPSNLKTLMETVPPYWKPILDMFKRRVGGDLETEEGLQALHDRSPVHKADQIKKPLLIAQGANDPRVKQAESDQFAEALREKGIPVTYVLYPDEGHGFANPQNRMSFFAITELFLKEHLGGQAEPIGNDFENSSHQFLEKGPEVEKLSA